MPRAAIALFQEVFGAAPRAVASAPGRVNLIGEHTDYNGGAVLPVALAARTMAAVGPGEDGILEAVSARDGTIVRVRWRDQHPEGWAAYLTGVVRELWAAEVLPGNGGVRIAVTSDVPIGAGLASSAALTVAVAKALTALAGVRLTGRNVAGIAFRAESDHVGVRCGLMDQMIGALGKRGHALLLECASLEARQVRFSGRLLVVETGVRHDLTGGLLDARRAECEAAVRRLRVDLPELIWLASWPAKWLARAKRALREPARSRAVHVIGETARVRFGAQLLKQGRLTRFGELMYESHESCRRFYECSCPELDTVVAAAKRAGALGAKVSGAGWGGAVVVLLGKGEGGRGTGKGAVAEAIRRAFGRAYGREPEIREVTAAAGARLERVSKVERVW